MACCRNLVCTERASADPLSPPCRFGFIKYKAREAARAALETLGGKQMADFPGQAVSAPAVLTPSPFWGGSFPHPCPSMPSMACNPDTPPTPDLSVKPCHPDMPFSAPSMSQLRILAVHAWMVCPSKPCQGGASVR